MVALFRASEGTLATKMLTLASTVLLLQEMKILPTEMYCDSCLEIQSSKIHSMLIISLLMISASIAFMASLSPKFPVIRIPSSVWGLYVSLIN